MTQITRRRACVSLALAPLAPTAFAQGWPTKLITLIVPGPAGGTPDIFARQFAEQLKKQVGQTVIVENKSGAAGIIGAGAAARAAPDGYTLLLGFSQTMAINLIAFKKLAYDPVADFVPIGRLLTFELGLVVPESVPAKTIPELTAWLNANSNKSAFGSFGNGTPSQFAGEMFSRKAGLQKIVHVAYPGSAPLTTAMLGGQVHYGFVVPQVALPHVKVGKLKLLAITGDERSKAMAQVPTMKELGFAEIVAGGWYGLFAPKGTPADIVDKLAKATEKAMQAPELLKVLAENDLHAAYLPPPQLAAYQKAQIAHWRDVAAKTNFTAKD